MKQFARAMQVTLDRILGHVEKIRNLRQSGPHPIMKTQCGLVYRRQPIDALRHGLLPPSRFELVVRSRIG
jgi:hypothetical protein